MSYNVTTWRTKRLHDFSIPFDALRYREPYASRGFHVTRHIDDATTGRVTVKDMESEMSGVLRGVDMFVDHIDVCGEGSGIFYEAVLLPALEKSAGRLDAVIIWEGGDCITRLRVDAGCVQEEAVEL